MYRSTEAAAVCHWCGEDLECVKGRRFKTETVAIAV